MGILQLFEREEAAHAIVYQKQTKRSILHIFLLLVKKEVKCTCTYLAGIGYNLGEMVRLISLFIRFISARSKVIN